MDGSDLELKGLSLIDEDDCLIDSSHQFDNHLSGNQMSPASFKEKGAKIDGMEDGSANINRTPEQLRSCESASGSDGKYNLRQSLAWDSAFFTNAGVLDSEELTSIIQEAEMKKKQALPRIQEETQKSTDSISSLESDSFSTASLESGLFEDIRASIQKSSGASNAKNISRKAGVVVPRMPDINTPKKVAVTSHGKRNSRPSSEKPSLGTASTGRTTKHVITRPQVPQPQGKAMAKTGASVQLLPRQPKLGRESLASTSTKRDSTGVSHIKAEKDNGRNAISRRASVSKVQNVIIGSRSIMPKPKPSSRSSSSSVVSKEPTASCSSIDSSGSALPEKIEKSPLKTKGKSANSKTRNSGSAGPTLQTPSKSSQPSVSRLSAYLRSATTRLSNISPASSISEWSVESCSSSSTVNQRSNSSQASFDTSSSSNVVHANGVLSQDLARRINSHEKHLVGVEGEEIAALQVHAKNSSAAGGALLPNSMKPTGLRMPSPKIGFFDGVKSRCSPNSSRQSNSIIFSGSPKVEAVANPHGGLTKGKTGRFPSARMIGTTTVARPDSKQMASSMMPKSREPSHAVGKVSTSLRHVKHSSGTSAMSQNGMHHKCEDKNQLKAQGAEAKRCDGTANNPTAVSAENHNTRDDKKSEIQFIDLAKMVKVTSIGHGSDLTSIETTTKNEDKGSPDNEIGLCRNFGSSLNTEKLISDDSFISCQWVPEHPSPRDPVFSQKKPLNSLSEISPSCSLAKPIVVSSRVPFTVKDSLTNVDNSSGFSRFMIPQVEKSLELPLSDRVKENC